MINLAMFDYDIVEVKVNVDGAEKVIGVHSGFTGEYHRAASIFSASMEAAKLSGIETSEEYDNHGITLSRPTEIFNKLRAQMADSIIFDWPIDAPRFESLLENQALCNVIISESQKKQEEFLKKKKN